MRRWVRHQTDAYWAATFLAFPVSLLCLVLLIPVVQSVWSSFRQEGSGVFTFDNYAALMHDQVFLRSAYQSLVYVLLNVALHLVLGLGLAMLLRANGRLQRAFRVVCLIPWTIPAAVTALTWMWLYYPLAGPLNDLLVRMGLPWGANVLWLADTQLALPSIIAVGVWRGFPFVMLVLLAGLQSIPYEQYEAARVDGASRWQEYRYVTLSGLRRVLVMAVILDAIWEFRRFDLVQVMTQGGPGHASETVATLVYKEYFRLFRWEYASAMSVVASLLILVLSLPHLRSLLQEG